MSKTYWILTALMVVFQITDVITTYIGMKLGRVEGNLFAKTCISEKSVTIAMKVLGTGIIFTVSYFAGQESLEIGSAMVGYALGSVVQATLRNLSGIFVIRSKDY